MRSSTALEEGSVLEFTSSDVLPLAIKSAIGSKVLENMSFTSRKLVLAIIEATTSHGSLSEPRQVILQRRRPKVTLPHLNGPKAGSSMENTQVKSALHHRCSSCCVL